MIEENSIQEAEMIEENDIKEAAKDKEVELWERPWYAQGQSSDGRQRRFSFACVRCKKKCLNDADQLQHMSTVHGTAHFFRDITETEIRIMTLQQNAIYNQEIMKKLLTIKTTDYSCGCAILPEELEGSKEQK